jgi:hypothetical protein
MLRRTMLKSLLVGVPVTAGGAAVASATFLKDKSQQTLASVEQRLDDLKKRFESADARNKKMIRIALGAAALSLGLDVSALL